jgi:hypothetical protein
MISVERTSSSPQSSNPNQGNQLGATIPKIIRVHPIHPMIRLALVWLELKVDARNKMASSSFDVSLKVTPGTQESFTGLMELGAGVPCPKPMEEATSSHGVRDQSWGPVRMIKPTKSSALVRSFAGIAELLLPGVARKTRSLSLPSGVLQAYTSSRAA